MKQKIQRQIRDVLDHPEPEKLPRHHRGLRLAMEVCPLVLRKIREDNLPMKASALTYRMIFGLVPMVVLGVILLKALVGMPQIQATVTDWTHKALDIEPVKDAVNDRSDLREQVDEIIQKVCTNAGTVELKTVGIAGFLLLVWAAVSLIVTTENIFNGIYRAPTGRPWRLRIPIYFTAMVAGPACVAGSLLASEKFFAIARDYVGDLALFGPLLRLAGSMMATVVTWGLLFALYKTLPSARVATRPALIGSFIAALGVEVLKALLFLLVFAKGKSTDAAKTVLYGSFALLPIALFWAYVSWFIVMAGLEVAWVCQSLGFLQSQARLDRARHAQAMLAAEAGMLVPAMVAVGRAFGDGRSISEAQLCRELRAPGEVVRPLMDKLVKAGFVHDVLGDDGNADGFRDWSLARAPGTIPLDELLTLLPVPDPAVPGIAVMKRSREAQIGAVSGMTLADAM